MTWFKVDDSFPQHPKVLRIPRRQRAACIGLWTLAGAWCARNLTDGHLDEPIVEELAGTAKQAELLVEVGLWERTDDGFQFHDWIGWQPTREQVEHKRDEEAKRKADWRRKRAAQRAASASGDAPVPDVSQRDNGVRPASVPDLSRSSRPDPTRPDPDSSKEESSGGRARKRATTAPPNLELTEQMLSWAAQNAPAVQVQVETDKFLDHHRAKGSLFKDWPAAWRTWIRNSQQYAERDGRSNVRQLPNPGQDGFTAAELDTILGPSRGMPQPPPGLSGEELWEWDQRTRREIRAERVRQANIKLGRVTA